MCFFSFLGQTPAYHPSNNYNSQQSHTSIFTYQLPKKKNVVNSSSDNIDLFCYWVLLYMLFNRRENTEIGCT